MFTWLFFFSAQRRSFGGKIIFPLSSSVIPSVNSSGGISLLSDARWHYLLRGRWLQSAIGLNSPRRCWDGELHDILFLWWICECMCVTQKGRDWEKAAWPQCMCRQEGRKPHRTKGNHIQVLNGLCNCHHNSLILFSEGIKMIQGWKKCTASRDENICQNKKWPTFAASCMRRVADLLPQLVSSVARGDFNFRLVSV